MDNHFAAFAHNHDVLYRHSVEYSPTWFRRVVILRMQKAQNQSKVGCPQSPRIRIFPWSDFEEHDGRCRNGEKPKDDYVPLRPPALKSCVSELQDGSDANKRVTTLSFELITSRSQLLQDDFLRCQRKRQHWWTVTIVGRSRCWLFARMASKTNWRSSSVVRALLYLPGRWAFIVGWRFVRADRTGQSFGCTKYFFAFEYKLIITKCLW